MSIDTHSDVPAQHLEIGGAIVTYRRAGAGAPLVYFHGSGLTKRWLPLYGDLAESFDVIVPEHPGYGDSVRPRWLRDIDDLVLHEADALDALGLNSFHAVGHSFGGVVAASFAALFPDRVRSLTLISPGPLPVVTPSELLEPLMRMFTDPPEDGDALLLNDNQSAYPEYLNGDDMGEVVASDDGSDPHANPDAFDRQGAPALYRRLSRVKAPRQLLVPDEDRLFPRGIFELWSRYLGDAPIVAITGDRYPTGHLLVVQEPRKIADAVGDLASGGGR